MLKRFCIAAMISITIMLICPLIASADGVNYWGDICLSLSEENSFAPASPGRLGVLSYGDGHFALHGDVGFLGYASYGTAFISNEGDIIISLTSTSAAFDFPQPGSLTYSASMYLIVNPSTLSGNFRVMGFSWEFPWTTTDPAKPFIVQGYVDIHECN